MKQITILSSSDEDVIAGVTALLAQAGVNIASITGEHYGAQAVVNVTVDREAKALEILQTQSNWQILNEDVLMVQVRDELGALARIARRLGEHGIVIRSIRFIERYDGCALVAISSSDSAAARAMLSDLSTDDCP